MSYTIITTPVALPDCPYCRSQNAITGTSYELNDGKAECNRGHVYDRPKWVITMTF